MKSITILILLGLISSLFSAPGDFLGTVHEFDSSYERIRGFAIDEKSEIAFIGRDSDIIFFDLFSWEIIRKFNSTYSYLRGFSYYNPIDHLAICSSSTEDSVVLIYKSSGVPVRSFIPLYKSAASAYCRCADEDTIFLRLAQYGGGKMLMRYSVPGYEYTDSKESDVVFEYNYSSFVGLTYDPTNDYLIAIVYQSDGGYKATDLIALNPKTCQKVSVVRLSWTEGPIYAIAYCSSYTGYGRCYLCTYYTGSTSKVIAIEPFPEMSFNNRNSSSSLPSPSLSISPNPFSTRLSLSLPSSGAVYSLTGQLIMKLDKGKHSIDTSSWREGVYIVKSGKETKRVVKVR